MLKIKIKLILLLLLSLSVIQIYSFDPKDFNLDNDFFEEIFKNQKNNSGVKLPNAKNEKIEAILRQKTRYSYLNLDQLPAIENFFFAKKVPSIIEDFISKLKNPNDPRYQYIKNCLVLNGPPGTGKTMIAELITRIAKEECNRYILSAKGNNFGDRFKNSEKEDLREYFDSVRAFINNPLSGSNQSVIILFDEFDGVAKDGEKQNQFNDNLAVVKQLNEILDAVQDDPRIAIIATTNYLENIDDSIFSRCSVVQIPAPDYNERVILLQRLIKDKNIEMLQNYPKKRIHNSSILKKLEEKKVVEKINTIDLNSFTENLDSCITDIFIHRLAYETADMTGRDIKDILERAHARHLRVDEIPEVPKGFGYDIYSGINFDKLNLFSETLLEKHLYGAYYEIFSSKYIKKERKNNNKIEHCPFEYYSQERRMTFPYTLLENRNMPQLKDILSYEDINGLPLSIDNFIKNHDNRLLIYGPRGTGKSTVAEHIARLTGRKVRYVSGNFGHVFFMSKPEELKKYFDDIKLEVKTTQEPVVIICDSVTFDKTNLTAEVIENIKALNKILISFENNKLISIILVATSYEKINNILNIDCSSIKIDYPDYKTRKKVFEYYFKANRIPNCSGLYISALITHTKDWHISTIKDMINNAAIQYRNSNIEPKIKDRELNMWQDSHLFDFKNRKLSPIYAGLSRIVMPIDYLIPTTYSRFYKFLHEQFLIELEKNKQHKIKEEKPAAQLISEFIGQSIGGLVVRQFAESFLRTH